MVDIELHKAVFRPDVAKFYLPDAGMRNQNITNMIRTQTLCGSIESQPLSENGLIGNIKESEMTNQKITEPKIGLSENHLTSNLNNDTIEPTKYTSDALSRQLGDNHQSMADESAEYPISTKATRRASLESASCSDSRDITKQRGLNMTADNLVVIHDNQAITTSKISGPNFRPAKNNLTNNQTECKIGVIDLQKVPTAFNAGMRTPNTLNKRQLQTFCKSIESQPLSENGVIENKKESSMTADNLVVIHDNQAITTSIKVAEVFGKEHKHVLDRIKQLTVKTAEIQGFDSQRNFAPADYTDEQGKSRPMYELSRDGFTLLAMGFTGKKALEFKLAYINQFNKMEQKLKAPDFTTSLTVVKQHSRKLPTVRVKKEIVLTNKQMSAIGAMIKNCVHSEMASYVKLIKEPSFNFDDAYTTAYGNMQKAVNTYNKREFIDASDAIRKFGYACYNMGTLDAVNNLIKQGKISER